MKAQPRQTGLRRTSTIHRPSLKVSLVYCCRSRPDRPAFRGSIFLLRSHRSRAGRKTCGCGNLHNFPAKDSDDPCSTHTCCKSCNDGFCAASSCRSIDISTCVDLPSYLATAGEEPTHLGRMSRIGEDGHEVADHRHYHRQVEESRQNHLRHLVHVDVANILLKSFV